MVEFFESIGYMMKLIVSQVTNLGDFWLSSINATNYLISALATMPGYFTSAITIFIGIAIICMIINRG